MKRIAGVDLSLSCTGVCISVPYNAKGLLKYEIFPAGNCDPARMNEITARVMEQVQECDPVILEDFGFASQSGFAMGGLGWLVRWHLWKAGIPYICVAPTRLKKFATGKGNADKSVVLKEVYKRWGFDTENHNIADAFVLMQIGRALFGEIKAETKSQREVLRDILKAEPWLKAKDAA